MKDFITSTLLLLALLLPGTATAYDFEVDGIYYLIFNNEAVVTSGNSWEWDWEYGSYSGDVTIPESVTYDGTTYSVTAIDHRAFTNCNELTSVSIPNSVIMIEGYPFVACSSLTSIVVDSDNPKYDSRDNCNAIIETASNTLIAGCRGSVIPNSVTTIGNMAFQYCSGLTSVSIPNSVTTIGEMAFARCSDLTSVTIGNSVSVIGDWAFVSCRSLKSIIVDNGNPNYDSRDNCNAIIETASNTLLVGCMGTVIPGTVISIAYSAFYGSGLTSVDIPNSVTTIGKDAFFGCSGLTSVNIPNSVTIIGDAAFQSCSSLTSVDIPNSITAIGNGVFAWCYGLTSVNIPNSVTTIGSWAFGECGGLTSVNIPNSVTTIGSAAFSSCHLTSVTIPNSVTTIGDAAFSYCTGLTDVTIPNSVTHIGDEAFNCCWALTDVYSYITDLSKVTCGDMMFHADGDGSDFDYSGRTLHVPHGTAEAYQADEHWPPYFGQIVEDLMPDVVPGDVNSDLEVNIADVNATIDTILSGDSNTLADVNGDGEINIADINAIIDIILSGNLSNP